MAHNENHLIQLLGRVERKRLIEEELARFERFQLGAE